MDSLDNYDFGSVYRGNISKEDADKFATIFGEGSKALTELIKYCILNDINTLASCKGHPNNQNILDRAFETGYITFTFNEEYDNEFVCYLASIPFKKKGIVAFLDFDYYVGRALTLYVPAKKSDMSEEYFKVILDSLKEFKRLKEEGNSVTINKDIQKIVDYEFDEENQDNLESIDISYKEYKKYKREDSMLLKSIVRCPSSNKTSFLHAKLAESQKHASDVDDFIEHHR